ncbi:MAG: hypothetical protein ACWGQW_02915 [bacterium]
MTEALDSKVINALEKLPDDVLTHLQFTVPWQYDTDTSTRYVDADGFEYTTGKLEVLEKRTEMQEECWNRFHTNPQFNTAVRNITGRLTGWGFGTWCDVPEIQEIVEEIEYDPRNRLYNFWPKYVARAVIEGELFLALTVHRDGFVEVDFYDPGAIEDSEVDDGIIYHTDKRTMPLVYCIDAENEDDRYQIPSIFLAYYPELINNARAQQGFYRKRLNSSHSRSKAYNKLRGFYRFMIGWDRGFVTRRNIGYLRTVIEWLNHYENLKKYEIDHKKSAGAYLWIITMEDPKAFRAWLSLTDEQRRKTGIAAKKTPGSTLVLPPGMDAKSIFPNLPRISDSDTDIMQMITSGLNEPEDITTGTSRGTFASIKASRGPMSDRISDEVAYFERFLRYDFWGAVFYLRSAVGAMKRTYSIRECIGFKNQEPQFKNIQKPPERIIEINFPISEVTDAQTRASAYMGVKHGSVIDTLGIPPSEVAKRLGVTNYQKMRLQKATEEDKFPELISTLDMESVQETMEAEPGPNRAKKPDKKPKTKMYVPEE